MHTDQEPHFIVIGTIYFMSQWLYFSCPSHSFFSFFFFHICCPLFKIWAFQLHRTDVRRRRLQGGEASQLSTDASSDFWLLASKQRCSYCACTWLMLDASLISIFCLPLVKMLMLFVPPHLSSLSSPPIRNTFQLSDVCVPRVWHFLNSVPVTMYTSWHTFQLKCVSLQQSNIRWPCWLVKTLVPTVTDYPNHPTDCAT